MVTIKDLARASGFSSSTVSRALADSKLIPVATRELIQSIARELGYVPNILAKSLKTRKTYNIGVISFVDSGLGIAHYFFSSILDSFVNTVVEKNYDVTLISKKYLMDDADLVGHCRSRSLDGVLFLCADSSLAQVQKLITSDIPVVIIDSFDEAICEKTHCITSNNRAKMFEMTDYIISVGHKNIVYMCGEDIFVTRERIKGFKMALAENGMTFCDEMLVSSKYYNIGDSAKQIEDILDRANPPTCIIVQDDYVAIKAYSILQQRGLEIGADVSVAGFDGLEIPQQIFPKLTTVIQDTATIGRTAANCLLDIINGKKAPFIQVIPAKFVKRDSVCCHKTRK